MTIQEIQQISIILIIFSIILFVFCISVGIAILNINSYIKKIYDLLEDKNGKNSVGC